MTRLGSGGSLWEGADEGTGKLLKDGEWIIIYFRLLV